MSKKADIYHHGRHIGEIHEHIDYEAKAAAATGNCLGQLMMYALFGVFILAFWLLREILRGIFGNPRALFAVLVIVAVPIALMWAYNASNLNVLHNITHASLAHTPSNDELSNLIRRHVSPMVEQSQHSETSARMYNNDGPTPWNSCIAEWKWFQPKDQPIPWGSCIKEWTWIKRPHFKCNQESYAAFDPIMLRIVSFGVVAKYSRNAASSSAMDMNSSQWVTLYRMLRQSISMGFSHGLYVGK